MMLLYPPDVAETRLGVVPAVRAATELTAPHPPERSVTGRWKGWARLKAPLRPRTRTYTLVVLPQVYRVIDSLAVPSWAETPIRLRVWAEAYAAGTGVEPARAFPVCAFPT